MGYRRRALGLVVIVLAAAGCAQNPTDTPGASVSSSASASATPDPSTSPPPGSTLTVRGAVFEGVEPGCLLLRADNGIEYLLLGGDRALMAAGARLEVLGRTEPELMTTCQQGVPFQVTEARLL